MSAAQTGGRATRADTRERALARLSAAMEAQLAGGASYSEISVEALAREAGFAKSTFYFYFEDKAALLTAAAGDARRDFLAAAEQWFSTPFDMTRKAFEDRLAGVLEAYRRHERILGAVVQATSQDAAVRGVYREAIEGFASGLARHLEQGARLGRLDAALDPARTAAWLAWAFEGGLDQMVRGASDAEARADLKTLAEMIWSAVYATERAA